MNSQNNSQKHNQQNYVQPYSLSLSSNSQQKQKYYPQHNSSQNYVQQYPQHTNSSHSHPNQSGQQNSSQNYVQQYPQHNNLSHSQPNQQNLNNLQQQYPQQSYSQPNLYSQNPYQQPPPFNPEWQNNYYQQQQYQNHNQMNYHQLNHQNFNEKNNKQKYYQQNINYNIYQNTKPKRKQIKSKYISYFDKHKIHQYFHYDLQTLENFDIYIIADDSGSMKSNVDGTNKTRWDELKDVIKMVIELSTLFDQDGIDLHFLNRKGYRNVTSFERVRRCFKKKPSGTTPLSKAIGKALRRQTGKPMLLIIATDGKPDNLSKFTRLLKNRDCNSVFVSILACSDREKDVGYLNKLDREIPNVDVLDDYRSEKKEVLRAQGHNFNYNFDTHVARLLLGAIYPKYDQLDETKVYF